MNLVQLEYFLETLHSGSYAVASSRMFVTSQAIAKSIHELEYEFGAKLFAKEGRGITPTPYALAIAYRVEEQVRLFDEFRQFTRDSLHPITESGSINLGIAQSYDKGYFFTSHDFDAFQKKYPNHKVNIMHLPNESCMNALNTGIVDAVVALGDVKNRNYDVVRITDLQSWAVFSDTYGFASSIDVEQLDGCKITIPCDVGFAFEAVKKASILANVRLKFTFVPMDLESQHLFIEDGGVIVSTNKEFLETNFRKSRILPITRGSGFVFPLCFITPHSPTSATASLLKNYLLKLAKIDTK